MATKMLLEEAARSGKLEVLDYLVKENPAVVADFRLNSLGASLLHEATKCQHRSFVRELMKIDPDVAGEMDKDGFRPLDIAVIMGNLEIVKELLRFNQDLCVLKGKDGRTALHYAAIKGRIDVIGVLLNSYPDSIEDLTVHAETALHLAVRNHQFDAFTVLLEWAYRLSKESMVNMADDDGNTILHLAVLTKQYAGLKPTLSMILVQTLLALITIGYKLAMNDGMRVPVLVAYRFMFGAAFIVPIAFFAERKKRPKLTWKIVLHGFCCGLFGGSLGQNLYLKSLALTSATFASAMMNLVPAMTFLIAVCLRLEKLGWKSSAGKAKVFGTILGIGGAMLLTFYKGPVLNIWNTNLNLLQSTTTHHLVPTPTHQAHTAHHLVLGALLSVASCACYSLWLIVQAKAAELYPCPYSITAMMNAWASIQGTAFALCTQEWSDWIMGWDIRLLTVVFAGVLGSGVMFTLMAWCVRMRGPLFVSAFNPLLLVVVAIAGSLLLEEKLHLGMVLGAILIIGGLYVALWGKGKELKKMSQLMPEGGQMHVDMPPPASASAPPLSGSSHGCSNSRKEEERDEERRDFPANSEILGGLYMCP